MNTLLALLCLTSPLALSASPAADWAAKEAKGLLPLYQYFHEHPELSFEEKETSARMARELKAAGYEVHTGVGKLGVVALLKNGPGRTVMLRADMDALPVLENTGVAHPSKNKGVMHACGHDIHLTNLVGTARFLASRRDLWKGTLMLVVQPAEERGGGAEAMMKDGLFKRFPKPDVALALHVDGEQEVGKVSFHSGYAMAGADSVDITMKGRGGHGARPHIAIDPIYLASQLVLDLQALISRERDPLEPAVITVGAIHGGTKHNIIPETCELQLTVRTFTPESRKRVLDGIERKAKAVAQGAGAPAPTIVVEDDAVPSLYNDPATVKRVVKVLGDVLGEKNVEEAPAVMGAEDFGRYAEAGFPIFIYWLGTVDPKRMKKIRDSGKTPPSLHSAYYYPDTEPTLKAGMATMGASAIELFRAP